MTAQLVIDEQAFYDSVMAEFQKVKVPCQSAMAATFYNTVMANFDGGEGQDRPIEWEKLRAGYANFAHGGDRTPRLQLSGELKSSVQGNDMNPDAAVIFCDSPYGSFHQEGGTSYWNNKSYEIPARPFFPIANGEVTPQTTQKCLEACEQELIARLK